MTSPLRRIGRNFGMLLSGQVMVTGLAFVALGLNTRALGPEDLGKLFLVQATCELTSKAIAFQNWQTFIKLGAENVEGGPNTMALWVFGFTLDFVAAALAAAIAAAIFLFAPSLIGLDADTARWGLFYAAALLVSGTSTCVGTLRLYDRFGQVVSVNTLQAALLLFVAAVMFWIEAPLAAYLVATATVIATTSLLMMVLGFRRIRQKIPSARSYWPDTEARRRFFSFAFGVSASATLNAFRQRGEVLMVGAILTPAAAALFGVAYRLAAVIARFAESARVSIYPEISRMVAAGSFRDAAALAFRLTRWTTVVAAFAIGVLLFAGSNLLAVAFGDEFRAAAPNLVLLGIGTALYACIFAFGPLVQIAIGSWHYFLSTIIAFGGFVTFGALGPYFFGQPGAGAGAVAFSVVLAVLLHVQIRRHLVTGLDT